MRILKRIVGDSPESFGDEEKRRVSTQNKKGAQKIRRTFTAKCQKCKLREHLEQLNKVTKEEFGEGHKEEFERIDKEMGECLAKAENAIPLHTSNWWSLKLHEAFCIWKYWKLRWSVMHTKCTTSNAILDAPLQKLSSEVDIKQGKPDVGVLGQLRMATNNLRVMRKNSYELRRQKYEEMAQEEALLQDKEKTKILKRMLRCEAMTRMYQVFRAYIKPPKEELTCLLVPNKRDSDGNMTE